MFFKMVTFLFSLMIIVIMGYSFVSVGNDLVLGGANYTYYKKIERDITLIGRSVESLSRNGVPITIENILDAGYLTDEPSILGNKSYKVSSDGSLISASIDRKSKVINDSVCHLLNNKENVKIIRFEIGMTSAEKKMLFVDAISSLYPKKTACSIIVYFTKGAGVKLDVNAEYLITSFSTVEEMKAFVDKNAT